jgi:hypothetical protein
MWGLSFTIKLQRFSQISMYLGERCRLSWYTWQVCISLHTVYYFCKSLFLIRRIILYVSFIIDIANIFSLFTVFFVLILNFLFFCLFFSTILKDGDIINVDVSVS